MTEFSFFGWSIPLKYTGCNKKIHYRSKVWGQ